MHIREAVRGDEHDLMAMIKGLAEYEKEPDAVRNTPEELAKHLFDEKICHGFMLEHEGESIGFAIYYISYSTWNGPCLYLEDLYVKPERRGTGGGALLFDHLLELAKSRGYARMDWQILDWNEPAIEFYKRKGATIDTDWYNGRMFFK